MITLRHGILEQEIIAYGGGGGGTWETTTFLPTFSSATSGSYTASTDSTYDANTPAWKAFNKNTGWYPNDTWISGTPAGCSAANPKWLKMDCGSAVAVWKYKCTIGRKNNVFDPKIWDFQGSNNDTDWTTLHSVTMASNDWVAGTYKEYEFSASPSVPTAYRYYRMYFTGIWGNSATDGVGMTELDFFRYA